MQQIFIVTDVLINCLCSDIGTTFIQVLEYSQCYLELTHCQMPSVKT